MCGLVFSSEAPARLPPPPSCVRREQVWSSSSRRRPPRLFPRLSRVSVLVWCLCACVRCVIVLASVPFVLVVMSARPASHGVKTGGSEMCATAIRHRVQVLPALRVRPVFSSSMTVRTRFALPCPCAHDPHVRVASVLQWFFARFRSTYVSLLGRNPFSLSLSFRLSFSRFWSSCLVFALCSL
jgi:hypothetical protein